MQETHYVITPFALGVNRRHHSITDVSSGSLADIGAATSDVCFTPKSRHSRFVRQDAKQWWLFSSEQALQLNEVRPSPPSFRS
jgi:hypothetical protein